MVNTIPKKYCKNFSCNIFKSPVVLLQSPFAFLLNFQKVYMCSNFFHIHKVEPMHSNLYKMECKLDYQIYAISLHPLLQTKERETLFYNRSSINTSLGVEIFPILQYPFCCILGCIKLSQVNWVTTRSKQQTIIVCCIEHLRCSALEFYDYFVCSVHSNSIS